MRIRFKSIDIENFRSIAKAKIILENQGTIIVKGINEYEEKATSNGSGKSSIFEAIIFSLFDETSNGDKDVANRVVDNGYCLVLEFQIDNINYTIQRKCQNNKTSVVLLKENQDISARNRTDTNKIIAQLLGINKSIFLDSIFLSQNVSTNLASLTPTARKERLEILTNTDYVITDFKEKLKGKQNDYEAKCVEIQMNKNKLNGVLQANAQQINDLESKISKIKAEIEALKSLGDLKEIEDNIQKKETIELIELDNKILSINKKMAEKELEIKDVEQIRENNLTEKDNIERLKQDKLAEWNVIQGNIQKCTYEQNFNIQDNTRLDKEIEKVRNSDTCPTCGRKYEDANEEHIQETISNFEKLKKENLEKNNVITNTIENYIKEQQRVELDGKTLANELLQICATIDENKNKIMKLNDEMVEFNKEKQSIEIEKNSCIAQINELKDKKDKLLKMQQNNLEEYDSMVNKLYTEINKINTEINQLDEDYESNNECINVIKHSIQLVTKEFRTYLLQNSLKFMNKLLSDYSQKLFSNSGDIIYIECDDSKLNIKLGNATYESLSGGEKTRVNIALLLAQKSLAEMIGNISCNIIILDEILGYCDSQAEESVIELIISELETLESIYMVSHKEIPIGYDRQLLVIKDKSGISRISDI